MSKELFVSFFLYVKEVKDFIVFVILFCKVIEVCKGIDIFGFGSIVKEFVVVFVECFCNIDNVVVFEGFLLGEIFCIILDRMFFKY